MYNLIKNGTTITNTHYYEALRNAGPCIQYSKQQTVVRHRHVGIRHRSVVPQLEFSVILDFDKQIIKENRSDRLNKYKNINIK
jgi:hypothetical protein